MNARVFLLVLVTAAFMAIWDADRPAELRQVVAQSTDATATPLSGIDDIRVPAAAATAKGSQSGKLVFVPPISANEEKLVPLPMGLPTGTWQAFNHDGDTIRITIERSMPSRRSGSNVTRTTETAANSCVITGTNGVRWCFVKEKDATVN
jgi:hypothetical protein